MNNLIKKGVVVAVIFLFIGLAFAPSINANVGKLIGVSALSSVSSKDISISNEMIVEDNAEIGLVDNNEEIITRIYGRVWFEDIQLSIGIIEQLEVWDRGWCDGYITIKGFKKPLYPLYKSYFNENPSHVIASQFIGFALPLVTEFTVIFFGVALGNIEWS